MTSSLSAVGKQRDRKQSRRMSRDAKQREWIWEFFLKNCKEARMINVLLHALPFPNDNLELRRMFLLRSLSLQLSAGIIDELALDILRGLGEFSRVSGGARRERPLADFSSQDVANRRKVVEDDANDENANATNSSTPQEKVERVPPWTSEQRRESSKDARKSEAVVGIRDWMKGRALPRSVVGDQAVEDLTEGSDLSMEGTHTGNARTPHETGDRDRSGSEFVFRSGQPPVHWELELAVMLELAVKHLRGDSPDRKSFEHAVTKYWGGTSDDIEAWPPANNQEMVRVRDQIKRELWMVRRNPELLDGVVEKYTKSKVQDMFQEYLEKAWAATGQTFLERVSADVVNGKYKPVNCNGQRPKKAGTPLDDGGAGQKSNGNVDTSEKPWIRASRGRYSRTKEKLQKNFAIWDVGDVDERDKDGAKTGTELQAGGPSKLDRGHGLDDKLSQKYKTLEIGEVRPPLSTEGGFEIDARSLRFDGSVARVLEFEEPDGPESMDGEQSGQETRDTVRATIEITEVEHREQADGPETAPGRDDMDVSISDIAKAPGISHEVILFEGNEREATIDENTTKEARSPKGTDEKHDIVNKESVSPLSSPRATDPNPTLGFSPPPWVEESAEVHVAEGIGPGVTRKRKSGSIQEDTGARREEESESAQAAAPTTCSNQSPETVSTRRNLRRKQRVLDAAVQDPLPKILTSRPKGSLLERNATARTVEWEDDDDIEESPSQSPSASRHVRLPNATTEGKISPLLGLKTSGDISGNRNAKHTRRKARRWSEKEVESLKREVGKYGKGRWKLILEKNLDNFQGRTEVDLKDKWRNLERFEGITD